MIDTVKIGDVVKLRTGSPPMTIGALSPDGVFADVVWFEQGEGGYWGELKKERLLVAALVAVPANPSDPVIA